MTKVKLDAISILKQDPNIPEEELFNNLKQLNSDCDNSSLIVAITNAKEVLFKPEYLTPEIAEETDDWDKLES